MAGTLVKTLAMQIVADPGDSKAVLADLNAQGAELEKPHAFVLTADSAQAVTGIDEATAALDKYLDAALRTAQAQADLDAKMASGTASDAELAAAHDKVTTATLAQLDASVKLAEAEAREADASKASADTQVASAAKTDESAAAADGAGLSFGKFGVAATAALVGVGYESTKLAVGFQNDMEMIHTQAGVAQSALPGLEQGVLSLSGKVAESPDSLAEALYHVESSFASIGITGPKALNLVQVAAEGAVTGHADLVDVTNALDAAVASGIPGVQNYSQAMGQLNAIVGSGDMKMQDLAEAMGTGFMSNVKIYGATLTDVGAILATFGDNNIRGAQAGTQLRMSVQSLAVQASTAGPYLKELGLQVGELGKYQSIHGTVATVNLLVDKMKAAGITSQEEGNVITELFGKKAGAGIAILADQIDRVNSKVPELTKGAQDFGSSAAAAYQQPAVKLKQLEAGAEAAGTSLGLVLLPALEHLLGPMVSFFNWIDTSSTKMDVFAGAVGVLAGTVLVAKLGGAIQGGIKDFQALGGMVQAAAVKLGILSAAQDEQTVATEAATVAQGELDVAMDANPIGLIIIAVVALIAVIVLLVTHFHDVEAAFDVVRHAAATAGHDIAGAFDTARHDVATAAHDIASVFDTARHDIASAADDVVRRIERIPGALESNFKDLAAVLVFPVGMAVHEITTHVQEIEHEFDTFRHNTAADFDGMGHDVSAAWDGIRHDAAAAADGLVHDEEAAFDGLRHDTASAWDGIRHDTAAVVDAIPGDIEKEWDQVRHDAAVLGDDVLHAVESLWSNAETSTSKGAADVVSFFEKLPGEVTGQLEALPGEMLHIGEDIVSGLLHGVEDMASQLLGEVSSLAGDVEKAFTDPLSIFSPSKVMYGHGVNVVQGVIDGVKATAPSLQAEMGGLAAGIDRTVAAAAKAAAAVPPMPASAGAGGAPGAAGGGDTYNFNVPEFSNPTETAQKLQTMLRDLKRRNGGASLGLA